MINNKVPIQIRSKLNFLSTEEQNCICIVYHIPNKDYSIACHLFKSFK